MAEELKHNATLKELDMSGSSLGERGAIAMAKFSSITVLKVLGMSENLVGDEEVLAMAEFRKYNTTLRELNMSWIVVLPSFTGINYPDLSSSSV